MKHSLQMSETLRLGIILALSGGFMDAYSYLERGNVFANAQTGNLLLFGVNLAEGNYFAMLSYLLPVLAFTLGILLADTVRCLNIRLHWRQLSILLEAVISVSYTHLDVYKRQSIYQSRSARRFLWRG